MKIMKMITFLVIVVALFTSGCATQTQVPFRHQMRQEYQLSDKDLKDIQYYVAGRIILQRDLAKDEVMVTPGHEIKIVKDRRVEEVVIQPGTPGIAEKVDEISIEVSFEPGNRLNFGSTPDGRESWGGKYSLFASSWDNGIGRLTYGGKEFYTVGYSSQFYLTVDLSELNNFIKESRTVKGRRLDRGD